MPSSLPDGRCNIVLRGMEKFRITGEDSGRAYRIAHVETIDEPSAASSREDMQAERRRLEALLVPQPDRQPDPTVPSSMPDEDLVNALAQYLELEPVEKQALLERDGLLERCRSLIELLEMKVLVAHHSWERDGRALRGSIACPRPSASRSVYRDLAVEPAVLDEDLAARLAGHHRTDHVQPWHVGLERLRIVARTAGLGVDLDACGAQQAVSEM